MENEKVVFGRKLGKAMVIGAISSIAASILLLVLFSVFMTIQRMPSDGGFYLSFVIISLAAMFGGFVGARVIRQKGLLTGGLVGLTYITLIALIGGAAGFAVNLFGTFLLKMILSVLFGGIGGVLNINLSQR